ncbi:MAG: hypothetical protein R3F14_38645 [Polyangiaceae bacterium]
MAKRTGSSAHGERATRGMERKDVAGERTAAAKTLKKRPSREAPPGSSARAKRATKGGPRAAVAPPKSTAQAKRTKTAGARAEASREARVEPARRKKMETKIAVRGVGARDEEPAVETARVPPRIPTPPALAVAPRSMELEWTGDPGGSTPPAEATFDRWVRRGDELLRRLAEHGAASHEYRVNLEDGRFFWVDEGGRVSAEAKARLVCSYVPQTASLAMGWADGATRAVSTPRVIGMAAEIDDIDEEGAWRIAMHAAEVAGAQYLYRVRSAAQSLFLALAGLTFTPSLRSYVPSTPVAMVLATLEEAREATLLGAEPVDTLRARLSAAGASLMQQAEFAHRDTDWVARLLRAGKRLGTLADRLPRPTFHSVAKGGATLWLDPNLASDLVESIEMLEEEWRQFA